MTATNCVQFFFPPGFFRCRHPLIIWSLTQSGLLYAQQMICD